MGLYKCGGGGALKETTLWTNASPTSSFATQTVTISDSITNYKMIGIEYKNGTSTSDKSVIYMNVSDFINTGTSTGFYLGTVAVSSNTRSYVRNFYYSTDTSIAINNCFRINGADTNNANCIPLKITGLK